MGSLFRLAVPLALLALPASVCPSGGAGGVPSQRAASEEPRLKDVQALQELIEKAIEQAEPSIACILVSRSDVYQQLGAAPAADNSGKLGGFDLDDALRKVPDRDEERRRQVRGYDLSHPDTVPESYGSGVVLDEAGLILTQAHVVRNATKVYVRLPGHNRGSYADIYASDPRSDLAVLRLIDLVPHLKPLKFGDGGKVRKGQFVISLANPYAAGFRDGSPSASWGIVSNLRRRAPGPPNEIERNRQTLHQYGTLIQTDTRLNLGSSGGALLNLRGELIGLTTSVAAISGTDTPGGYAVPVDAGMKRIIQVLREGKEVEYGFLGVILDPDAKPGKPVQLRDVAENSPAQRGGLQRGDYILAVEGEPVRDNDDLFLFVGLQLAGGTVHIDVARTPDGPPQTRTVTLAKFYVPGKVIAAERPPARCGLRVDWTSLLGQRGGLFGRRGIPDGVLIREVVPNSPADKANLQVDKVITHVNGQPVTRPSEFYQKMAKAVGPVELTVLTSQGREELITLENK
jgi:S1-C subfamily serine protease